jgi:uncharacterized protein YoxC
MRDAATALDGAHRTAARFAVGLVRGLDAVRGGRRSRSSRSAASHVVDRLVAFAALGLLAAAANTLLAARVMAPVAERSRRASRREPRRDRAPAAARLDAAPARRRARARARVLLALARPGGARGAAPETRRSARRSRLADRARGRPRARGARERAGAPAAAALRDAARRAASATSDGVARRASSPKLSRRSRKSSNAIRNGARLLRGREDGLGSGIGELDTARESVLALTDAQVADVQRLTQSMSSVYSHAEKISESIQDLRLAIDESSSSVTELGAAGEQLVGTARELTSRADTVSSSIQRALATIAEVASSTDVLAGVAGDASSSMEEMATSMNDVNGNAERCSELSDQVVGVADQGSRIVQQTMDGMHAIREATATAESVIRGLGDRAGEIGAIVGVIDGVASETSLLALNAAIIAGAGGRARPRLLGGGGRDPRARDARVDEHGRDRERDPLGAGREHERGRRDRARHAERGEGRRAVRSRPAAR